MVVKSIFALGVMGIFAIGLALAFIPSGSFALASNVPCPGVSVTDLCRLRFLQVLHQH